jgi:hypothetical protein
MFTKMKSFKFISTTMFVSVFLVGSFFVFGNVANAAPVAGTLTYTVKNSLTHVTTTHQLTADTFNVYDVGDVSEVISLEELKIITPGFIGTPHITAAALNGNSGSVPFTYNSGNSELTTTAAAGSIFKYFPYQPGINTLIFTFSDSVNTLTLTLKVNILTEVAYQAELTTAKTTAHGVLSGALTSYTQTNYTSANWTTLNGFKTTGDTAINAATDLTNVTSAQNTATAGMAGVVTDLLNAKTAAHNVLNTTLATYSSTNYSDDNWTTLNGYKTAGDTAIDAATTTDAVTSAQNTATTSMTGVQTIAQSAAEALIAAQTSAHSVLNSTLETYTQSNYTAENWTALNNFKIDGDTAIDAATDLDGVNAAQNGATAGMAGVVKEQTITFNPLSDKTYSNPNFDVSATATSGLGVELNSQTPLVCTVYIGSNGSAVHLNNAGTCTIRASQVGNSNYNPAPDVDQSFTVQAIAITVTADAKSKLYGASDPAFTFTSPGLFLAESLTGVTCDVSGAHVNVGTYPITCSGNTNTNYSSTYIDGILTINVNSSMDSTVLATTTNNVNGTKSGNIPDATTRDIATSIGTVTIDMPADLTVTGPSGWDSTLNLPTVVITTVTPIPDVGNITSVVGSIEVGSGDTPLTLNQAVKLTFTGQAGNFVGWSQAGVFHQITALCDSPTNPTLNAGSDCKINVGNDLIVWTKHFSTFTTYTQTTTNTNNNNNGGGGFFIPPITTGQVLGASTGPMVISGCDNRTTGFSITTGQSCVGNTSTPKVGQVLGATTFRFSVSLKKGFSSDAVKELQDRLRVEGFFTNPTSTKYFGDVTFKAVKAYQKAHKLPQTGLVGKLTIAELNK